MTALVLGIGIGIPFQSGTAIPENALKAETGDAIRSEDSEVILNEE